MSVNRYTHRFFTLSAQAPRLFSSTSISSSFVALLVALGALSASSAFAPLSAQGVGLRAGEAFVTRFSGVVGGAGAGSIDVNGVVGSVVDIRNPGFAANGAHWINEPQHHRVTAGEIGQVFGIAFDDASPPNIYLAATSAFGLHPGAGARWMPGMWGNGGPGAVYKLNGQNNYKPELFATITLNGRPNSGAALGNIAFDKVNRQLFVSDMETGMIHRLSVVDGSELGRFDHGVEGRGGFLDAASGVRQALEPVAFDPASTARFNDCPSGAFSKTVSCWNVADFRRRIWGLGVNGGRLYYAVWGSQGFGNPAWAAAGEDQNNTIWSIGIGAGGALNRADIRREFAVPGFFATNEDFLRAGGSNPVSDIAFSKHGVMLLAERGGMRNLGLGAVSAFSWPNESRVLRFERDPAGVWQGTGRYDIGFDERKGQGQPFLRAAGGGGVDFGFAYGPGGRIDLARRDEFVWNTGDSLCSPSGPCFNPATGAFDDTSEVSGLQGQALEPPAELIPQAAYQPYPDPGPATPMSGPARSYLIDLHMNVDGAGAVLPQTLLQNDASHPGDVEIYKPAGKGRSGPGYDLGIYKSGPANCVIGGICNYTITITNNGSRVWKGPLGVNDVFFPQSGGDGGARIFDPVGNDPANMDWAFRLKGSAKWKNRNFQLEPQFASASNPWLCADFAGVVYCSNPSVTLLPGQSISLNIAFTIPAGFRGRFLRNCIAFYRPVNNPVRGNRRRVVLAVQRWLTLLGYSPGPINGVPGAATRAAIRNFRQALGLAPGSAIDKVLLDALWAAGSGQAGDANPGNDWFCVPTRVMPPHLPSGSVHLPIGSFHMPPRSPHRPRGSFHLPKGSFHGAGRSPHLPRGSVHKPKGSFHLLPKSPHRPRGSIHLPIGSKRPHVPAGSVHVPIGSKQPHIPAGSFHRPAHMPRGSVSRPVHKPVGSIRVRPRPRHNAVISRKVNLNPKRPVVRPAKPHIRKPVARSRVRAKVVKILPKAKAGPKVRILKKNKN